MQAVDARGHVVGDRELQLPRELLWVLIAADQPELERSRLGEDAVKRARGEVLELVTVEVEGTAFLGRQIYPVVGGELELCDDERPQKG